MEIVNKCEKIEFLEKILKLAQENPTIIKKEGTMILGESYAPCDEECIIRLYLDNNNKPYFKIKGTYSNPQVSGPLYNSEELLIAGERYLKEDLEKFKGEFHLHKKRKGGLDLIDKIR
jgi:hypothetical protein